MNFTWSAADIQDTFPLDETLYGLSDGGEDDGRVAEPFGLLRRIFTGREL